MPTFYALFLLAIVLHSSHCLATCYDVTGKANTDFFPCNIGGTSICCFGVDFCVNNNFCIQSLNFFIGVYGCTDQNWGLPCQRPCNGECSFIAGSIAQLFPGSLPWENLFFACPNTEVPDGFVSYCCGPDPTSCCSNKQYFSIPYIENTAVSIWRPVTTTTSLLTTDTAQLTTPLLTTQTTSPTTSTTLTLSPTTFTTLTPPPTQGTTSDKSLAIGLGVGLPVGVLLIGAITFLGWPLRRYNNRHTSNVQQEISQDPSQLVPIHKSELDASLPVQVVSELGAFPRQG
jgi:hypothetical protein